MPCDRASEDGPRGADKGGITACLCAARLRPVAPPTTPLVYATARTDHKRRNRATQHRHIDRQHQKPEGQHPKPKKRQKPKNAAQNANDGQWHAHGAPAFPPKHVQWPPQCRNKARQHLELPLKAPVSWQHFDPISVTQQRWGPMVTASRQRCIQSQSTDQRAHMLSGFM